MEDERVGINLEQAQESTETIKQLIDDMLDRLHEL